MTGVNFVRIVPPEVVERIVLIQYACGYDDDWVCVKINEFERAVLRVGGGDGNA